MTVGYYEFFAGGGMARAGLGPDWNCLFANDFDPKKAASYAENWGDRHLKVGDVARLTAADLPGAADLAWASFPCQDLSLAGVGTGLKGSRSGTFWPFWELMKALRADGRAPRMIVLENVYGALTSHGGKDFATICAALAGEGYRFGAMLVDAAHFVPQSRPRLFIVAVDKSQTIPAGAVAEGPIEDWHSSPLTAAYEKLSHRSKDAWIWWRLPPAPTRNTTFADVIEDKPQGVRWHTEAETNRLLGMMSPVNLAKVEGAKRARRRMVGGVYRRTRFDASGCREPSWLENIELRIKKAIKCENIDQKYSHI